MSRKQVWNPYLKIHEGGGKKDKRNEIVRKVIKKSQVELGMNSL